MLEEIVLAVRRRVSVGHFKVILFGSRAQGRAREGSDYDIGIEAQEKIPFEDLSRLETDMDDLPTLAKIDIVDLRKAEDALLSQVKEGGKTIYEKQGADSKKS